MLAVELIPDPTEGGYTAGVPDIPAYGEGETAEEAIVDLREALGGYIESFGLEDAMARVISPTVQNVDWNLAVAKPHASIRATLPRLRAPLPRRHHPGLPRWSDD